jgi:hypothetical protein
MTEKRQSGLSPNQIQNLYKGVEVVLIVASFWLALVNKDQVNVLFAQTLFLLSGFIEVYFLHSKTQKTVRRWNYFWLVACSGLIAFLVTRFYAVNLEAEVEYTASPQILITISVIAILAKLILVFGVKKTSLKMDFFRAEASWILLLIFGITTLISKFWILDLAIALGILIYVLVQNLISLDQNAPAKNHHIEPENTQLSTELDQKVIDELLDIEKIEKIYDLKIISPDGQKTVIGSLIVNNHSTQEDIYKIKQKAKKILHSNNFPESILETEYLAEFNQKEEIYEKEEMEAKEAI